MSMMRSSVQMMPSTAGREPVDGRHIRGTRLIPGRVVIVYDLRVRLDGDAPLVAAAIH